MPVTLIVKRMIGGYIRLTTSYAHSGSIAQLSPNYICVDGLYQTYLFVLGSSYDVRAAAGWSRLFIDMGEGIDVDIFIHKEPEYMTQQKLQFKIRSNKLKLKDQDDTSMDYEETAMAYERGLLPPSRHGKRRGILLFWCIPDCKRTYLKGNAAESLRCPQQAAVLFHHGKDLHVP